jgi:hypothetical protein
MTNEQDTLKEIEKRLSDLHDSFLAARDAAQAGMAQVREIKQFIMTSEIERLQAKKKGTP